MLHSKQWHYSLHRDFQNCYSTRRSPTGFFKLQFQLQFYTCTSHYNPEKSPSRTQFYMQKTKSSSSTTTTSQRAKRPSFQKRNSTHRRQGDLLEIHPCVLQDIPDIPVFPVFPDIPVIHDLPAFPGNSTNSTMFQYLQGIHPIPAFSDENAYSTYSTISTVRLVSTENSTEYQLSNYKHSTNIHSSKKGRCCDIGQTCIGKKKRCQDDIFPRIKLIPSFVLSSDNTNCKNDIQ